MLTRAVIIEGPFDTSTLGLEKVMLVTVGGVVSGPLAPATPCTLKFANATVIAPTATTRESNSLR